MTGIVLKRPERDVVLDLALREASSAGGLGSSLDVIFSHRYDQSHASRIERYTKGRDRLLPMIAIVDGLLPEADSYAVSGGDVVLAMVREELEDLRDQVPGEEPDKETAYTALLERLSPKVDR